MSNVEPSGDPTRVAVGDEFEADVERIATGGEGVTLAPDGRVVFVGGVVPGDRALVRLTSRRKRFGRGELVGVVRASDDRRPVPCPHVADGCGGCDWQHVADSAQRVLRRTIVADSLVRLGRFDPRDVVVDAGPELAAIGYRTVVRAGVVDGRAGFRAASSHQIVVPEHCLTAHPLVNEILTLGRFPGAIEVAIKVGARTGERMVVVTPSAAGATVPDGVIVIGRDELAAGRTASIGEVVGGRRLRVSADSFFQCRPDGADALVAAVAEFLADAPDGPMLDAYAGVGLFGATVGADRDVVAVESNPSSAADARVNLGSSARVVESLVEAWTPEPMAAVVADPARAGLGRAGVDAVVATGASHVALVSCDPASLARDARLLVDAGFSLERVRVVDLFGNTSHIEVVSRFTR